MFLLKNNRYYLKYTLHIKYLLFFFETLHIFLAFLTTFFSPPTAEKILISTYILLFSLGWIRLSQALNLKRSPFLLLLFPLLFQVFLFTGFYNYLLGLAGFLLLFSYFSPLFSWIPLVFSPHSSVFQRLFLLEHPKHQIRSEPCEFFAL